MKIAAYTIALNESKHVERWCDATKEADYRLVVDTGSTDNTVELLKSRGVVVHQITVKPFRFDDARNAALALLPDDIDLCLSLDMDEVPEEGFFQKVKDMWPKEATRAYVWWDTGTKWKNNNRLHHRQGYRWIKPCHEVTVKYSEGAEELTDLDLVVYHKPDDSKARTYYLPMLEAAVKEDPRDARMWHYYVRELYFHKKWDEIIPAAFNAMQAGGWYVERGATCRSAGMASQQLGNLEDAKLWYARACKEAPTELESWFSLAQFCYEIGNWQGCWDASNKRLELERDVHYMVDGSVWDWRCYDLMSISAWNLGRKEDALKYGRMALEANPNDGRLKGNVEFMENNVTA